MLLVEQVDDLDAEPLQRRVADLMRGQPGGWSAQSGRSPAQRQCDMKLYSILLGWIGILTKSCVSPQVFYGSRRLTGCPGMLRGRCQRSEAFRTMQ